MKSNILDHAMEGLCYIRLHVWCANSMCQRKVIANFSWLWVLAEVHALQNVF